MNQTLSGIITTLGCPNNTTQAVASRKTSESRKANAECIASATIGRHQVEQDLLKKPRKRTEWIAVQEGTVTQ